MTGQAVAHRRIATFRPRRGRVTAAQQRALDRLWPAYGVDVVRRPLDVPATFGRRAPLVLDVGFGMGETTVAMARADPARDVLAVDVHTPGAGALLGAIHERGLTNVRVVLDDALDVLADMLLPASLDEVRLFFPDPWPKARHRKRRFVRPDVVALVTSRLATGGRLHCATDWAPYAEQMLCVLDAEPGLHNPYGGAAPRPVTRPVTRYERQALAKGHQVSDVIAVRGQPH